MNIEHVYFQRHPAAQDLKVIWHIFSTNSWTLVSTNIYFWEKYQALYRCLRLSAIWRYSANISLFSFRGMFKYKDYLLLLWKRKNLYFWFTITKENFNQDVNVFALFFCMMNRRIMKLTQGKRKQFFVELRNYCRIHFIFIWKQRTRRTRRYCRWWISYGLPKKLNRKFQFRNLW